MPTEIREPSPPSRRPRDTSALLGTCLGFFVVLLDATIVTVALPSIGRDLSQPLTVQQWVLNAYTLVFAAFTLNGGAAGDRLGARRSFLAGLTVFSLGTIACACAPVTGVLLTGRVVQGLGAALVMPCSLALIAERFPTPRARAVALGWWGGISGIGLAAGPVIGGLLVDTVGWRWVFLVAVPVAAVSALLVVAGTAPSIREAARGNDPWGQLAAVVALACASAALMTPVRDGRSLGVVVSASAVAVIASVTFVAIERRVTAPMIPLDLVRIPDLTRALVIGFLFNFALYGTLFSLAIHLQNGPALSARGAGLVMLPMTAMIACCAAASGWVSARLGPRRAMVLGLALGAAGAGLVALTTPTTPVWLVTASAALMGTLGLAMPAMTALALGAVPARRAGLASGALNASRQVGGLVGVAVTGASLAAGDGTSPLTLAMLVVTAALCVALTLAARVGRTRAGLLIGTTAARRSR